MMSAWKALALFTCPIEHLQRFLEYKKKVLDCCFTALPVESRLAAARDHVTTPRATLANMLGGMEPPTSYPVAGVVGELKLMFKQNNMDRAPTCVPQGK